jgi:MarR family transcriptional regulator, organic hydroperoxide resistance regulator
MVQPRSRTPLSPPLPAVLTFMQVLWSVAHRLDQTSKRMRAQLGITGPQRLVLRVVGLYPGVSAGGLATVLHVHPSTLTGVLRRLQALRLLRRHADPRDRRRAVLRLTAGGRRANAVKSGTVEAAVAAAMFRCRDADVAAAGRVLAAVATQLESGTPPGATRRALPRKRGHHDDGV